MLVAEMFVGILLYSALLPDSYFNRSLRRAAASL